MNIVELFTKGGIAMVPLIILSIMALATIIERIWFWSKILTREREIVGRVMESARRDWQAAREIALRSSDQPIGRFLYSALELTDPDPEIFQLSLQTSGDEEVASMRRGEKILETVIAISPLLGLLGTVLGLIQSLGDIRLGEIGASTSGVTLGIAEALISTATGLIIAIVSLAFYRFFQGLVSGQAKVFRQSGNELELMYRKDWLKSQRSQSSNNALLPATPIHSSNGSDRSATESDASSSTSGVHEETGEQEEGSDMNADLKLSSTSDESEENASLPALSGSSDSESESDDADPDRQA
ncbi:MAG: MotA/TolQ/ExbB proton channel family protein [Elainellaceae cyanobacterium]